KSWTKIGGSVYLVNSNNSSSFRKLLKEFEGPNLKWFEFEILSSTTHVCTPNQLNRASQTKQRFPRNKI
ncbi:MAG: hypothetical protein ACK4GQ_00790, partial [Candidatus Hadarchaeales archaeon]